METLVKRLYTFIRVMVVLSIAVYLHSGFRAMLVMIAIYCGLSITFDCLLSWHANRNERRLRNHVSRYIF